MEQIPSTSAAKPGSADCRELADVLIGWLRAALHEEQPDEKPDTVTFGELYRFARFHGVDALAFYSVARLQNKPEPSLFAEWRRRCLQNVVKVENQRAERDRLIEEITAAGIDLMPLKGCRLIEYYPRPEYRMMADLDFLFDGARAEELRDLMVRLGYTVEDFGGFHHDIYRKAPYVEVEMHRHIANIPQNADKTALRRRMYDYTEKIWERVRPTEDNPHHYEMDATEYYIEMLLHFAKHILIAEGSGIRSIMDFAVYLSSEEAKAIDRAVVDRVMDELGLSRFRDLTEQLARRWFDLGSIDDRGGSEPSASDSAILASEDTFADAIIRSGTYGTTERQLEARMEQYAGDRGSSPSGAVRRRYLLRRIFPPLHLMSERYHVLRKAAFLLPIFWIVRLVQVLLFSRDRVRREARSLRAYDEKKH